MEVVMLKAKAQLQRFLLPPPPPTRTPRVTSEPPSGRTGGARGSEGAGGAAGDAPGMGHGASQAGAAVAPGAAVAAALPTHNATELYLNDYWLNSSLAWSANATRLDAFNVSELELLNATSGGGGAPGGAPHTYWFCAKWASAQQDFFQTANLCFAVAFLIPKSFKQSILVLRALAVAGFALLAAWAGTDICAPDVLTWNLLLVTVNSIHTVFLIIRFLPPALSLELTELYLKLFKPLKVSKKHFQELTREARVMRLEPGEAYAVEEVTPADERLSILLKGKLRVSCDGTHLHYILPHQFIDSPEWEANTETSDDVFQVSVVAEENCTCLCWPRMRLERVLRHRPMLKIVVDSLIGKDITHKLYSLSEAGGAVHAAAAAAAAAEAAGSGAGAMARSASVDAVHEGTRGRLRSLAWRGKPGKPGYKAVENVPGSTSYWKPMVARQFPRQSPFPGRALPAGPAVPPNHRLLAQASSASLQPPLTRKRSFTRKATSFRKTREVKFAEPTPVRDASSPEESPDGGGV